MARSGASGGGKDVRSALHCAEAYYRLAKPFIAKIPGLDTSGTRATATIGDLVACATNLPLAIEIVLKALLASTGKPQGATHDLQRLYSDLPSELQTECQRRYVALLRALKPTRVAITLAIAASNSEPPWNDVHEDPTLLANLLERSKDVFLAWRYIYEVPDPVVQPIRYHHFEYGLLQLAFEAIRDTVEAKVG